MHLEDRNVANKEKKVDTGIVTLMLVDALSDGVPGEDTVVLVAGDGDFVPAVKALKSKGFTVEVVFWDHASRELKLEASKFISLNPYLENLRY
ncbi:NYN domain-containing protein [Pseudomonas anguilliseptica]|uniref:NYN domain-containing protein n=1 Tax=Pseudomonas anguilliseptica TaxID=53406 RepID=UPI001ABF33A3|nr:NYN domain-containing protein [Pseudomonas anguilliseptica]